MDDTSCRSRVRQSLMRDRRRSVFGGLVLFFFRYAELVGMSKSLNRIRDHQ